MPTLENIDGRSLSADYSGLARGIEGVGMAIGQRAAEDRQREEQEAQRQQLGDLATGYQQGKSENLIKMLQIDPQFGQAVHSIQQSGDQAQAAKLKEYMRNGAIFGASLLGKDPMFQRNQLMVKAQEFKSAGNEEEAQEYLRMANMSPEELDTELRRAIAVAGLAEEELSAFGEGEAETKVVNKRLLERQSDNTWKDVTPAGGAGAGSGAQIPPALLKGLGDSEAEQVSAAYTAAGGGKDGVEAANKQRVIAQEESRRGQASSTLTTKYPNATAQEMTQLQAAIDSAPSVEKGLAAAETIRGKQRTDSSAAVMTDRSLQLATAILENPELDDVVGSSEGKYGGYEQPTGSLPLVGGFISDDEATAIADIEELTNILTVPAMDLMSGILSESDLKLLKTISGGAFTRTRGLERFRKDAGEVKRILTTASIIGKLPPRDREAAQWATDRKNKGKPQAKQILKKLGIPNG